MWGKVLSLIGGREVLSLNTALWPAVPWQHGTLQFELFLTLDASGYMMLGGYFPGKIIYQIRVSSSPVLTYQCLNEPKARVLLFSGFQVAPKFHDICSYYS